VDGSDASGAVAGKSPVREKGYRSVIQTSLTRPTDTVLQYRIGLPCAATLYSKVPYVALSYAHGLISHLSHLNANAICTWAGNRCSPSPPRHAHVPQHSKPLQYTALKYLHKALAHSADTVRPQFRHLILYGQSILSAVYSRTAHKLSNNLRHRPGCSQPWLLGWRQLLPDAEHLQLLIGSCHLGF
jgi:hypothetical protein